MKKFTLEWNAVITLADESRQGHASLKKLVELHQHKIDLGIVTTAASENTAELELPKTASQFRQRLAEVGLENLTEVYMIGRVGLTYNGLSIIARDNCEEVVENLWEIIAPKEFPRSHVDFAAKAGLADNVPISSPEYAKWRNNWCDVHSLYAHIVAERDVFVTGDVKNFKDDREDRLLALGVGDICSYDDALDRIA